MEEAALPPITKATATDKDGDALDDPPELVPSFMPTFRRVLSRFMNPKKKRRAKNRRRRGLRALISRMLFRSKFLAAPEAPPAPKPSPPEPTKPNTPASLRGRFNKPKGP